MTNTTHTLGAPIPALLLFRDLAQQMYRAGLCNSNDVIDALCTGLSAFARAREIPLCSEFQHACSEALDVLKRSRSEDDWERLLPQEATASKAPPPQVGQVGVQMLPVLEAAETAGMRPRAATWFGVWIVTAAVIGLRGPWMRTSVWKT